MLNMLNHEVSEFFTVDQNDTLTEVAHELQCIVTKGRGSDEHTLRRTKPHEAADEPLNVGATTAVVDAHGQSLAYFYVRDHNDAATAGVLTMDEARRMASNFAKLPETPGPKIRSSTSATA